MNRQRSISPLQPAALGPPTNWVPDEEASHCFLCHAEFGQVRRKHHCRLCGRITCGDCSQTRLRLQGYSEKQRICDECENRNRDDATLAIADEVRVSQQIQETLKKALKDQALQINKFKTFLLSLDETTPQDSWVDDFDNMMLKGESAVREMKIQSETKHEKYDAVQKENAELRKKYQSRQEDAQKLAARVLRAESKVEELSSDNIAKSELEQENEKQRKEIEALRERLHATMLAQNANIADGDDVVPVPSPRGVTMTLIAEGRNEEQGRRGRCDPTGCRDRCSSRCVVQ